MIRQLERRLPLLLAFTGGALVFSIPYNPLPVWATSMIAMIMCFFASWLTKGGK